MTSNVLAEALPSTANPTLFYCRVGKHGETGLFWDRYQARPRRGQKIVVRTNRGLEIGHVLAGKKEPLHQTVSTDFENASLGSNDGTILRLCTQEDQLLASKLQSYANEAYEACQKFLREQQTTDTLLEVEALLDARTLYFYFLGEPSEIASGELEKLAAIFQHTVQESQFARLLDSGCGPGCGTEEKGGCGTDGSCTVCVIAKACKKS
jgi:cell fate regulator YaaT (PSP1 superfamily)